MDLKDDKNTNKEELRALQKAHEEMSKRNKYINPTQLMSHEKRKELLGIKEREFDLTIIQVEFNFQYVLEVRFHPRETVSKLYDFVKTALDPKLLSINENFQLILPPHQVIKNYEKTFKELSMFPACTVRFYTDVPQDQYNGPYLKEEYIKKI